MRRRTPAEWLIRAAALLAPGGARREWREEWLAELDALRASPGSPSHDLPNPYLFALGAFPHALWLRAEDWTMDSLLQDLRYATRLLTRARGFTLMAALTLALGIGLNGSIFSLVNGLILRAPGGIHEPERLVQIARSYESAPRWDSWSVPALRTIGESSALSGVIGYWGQGFVLGRGTEAEPIQGQVVLGDYFGVLGVRPELGRLLQATDDREPTGDRAVVLSHALWSSRFARDPGIIGRAITLGADSYVVVGVAPAEFTGTESVGPPPMLWVPAWHHAPSVGDLRAGDWGASWIEGVGRLATGVSFEQAEAAMTAVSQTLRGASEINGDMSVLLARGVGVDPGGREVIERVSLILMGIAGMVLLLTCTNVATLSLARATARRTEVGVRVALGASRSRVGRQLVTEGLVLAALATLLALPIVLLAKNVLPLVVPEPVAVSLGADARVLLFLALSGLGAGLVFSAAPAWASSRRDANDDLRQGASTAGRARTRLRDALVVAQLALSLGLVAGAALLGRSVINARIAQPGFQPANLQVGFIDPQPTGRYDATNSPALYRRIVEAVAQLPGVERVTVASAAPLVGGQGRSTVYRPDQAPEDGFEAEYLRVGPDYFETLGIQVVRGRALGAWDDEPEQVVVVNEALAEMFFAGRDPVGQELMRGSTAWRIVGVVRDVQMRSLRQSARPGVYYPITRAHAPSIALHVRATGAPVAAEAIRGAVAAVDPELPITEIQSMQRALTASMGETRTVAYLIAGFALLALAIATVGLYGLVSYGVSQRVREMGLRLALGARPGALVRLMLARGVAIAGAGMVIGLGVSLLLGRALRGLLFEVAPTDLGALGAAALVLLAVATVAAWIPARRASRVDAAVSLRG